MKNEKKPEDERNTNGVATTNRTWTINKNKRNWQSMKMKTEPVSRPEALIPDDVILTRRRSLDTGYRDLDDATSSEIDCKHLFDRLHAQTISDNELGDVIGACSNALALINNSCVSLIRRQANLIAHNLVRVWRFHDSPHSFDSMPHCIHHLIINEMN